MSSENMRSFLLTQELPEISSEASLTPLSLDQLLEPAPSTDENLKTASQKKHPLFTPIQEVTECMIEELFVSRSILLKLNPSRRKKLLRHLLWLHGKHTHPEAESSLSSWMQEPFSEALKPFFEELALFTLAQALLLKHWDLQNVRSFHASDLSNLNWALSQHLRQNLSNTAGNWKITQPNLYSWFRPSTELQKKIVFILNALNTHPLHALSFLKLFSSLPKHRPSWAQEYHHYAHSFLKNLFQNLSPLLPQPAVFSASFTETKYVFFTPTLRNGSLLFSMPKKSPTFETIAFENNPYLLLLAEISQLWKGPQSPPLWLEDTGLDIHLSPQQSFSLKPMVQKQQEEKIRSFQAADLSIVFEERPIRFSARTSESRFLRKSLEKIPLFKKIKSSQTTLGILQALIALQKLRPGGLCLWVREHALSQEEGQAAIHQLLGQSLLLAHWDFSELKAPILDAPLFSKHLYLFKKEPDLQKRKNHYPKHIQIRGQIRSHLEWDRFFSSIFLALSDGSQHTPYWEILVHESPLTQMDWAQHWPEGKKQTKVIFQLEKLQSKSVPLGHVATIRPLPPSHVPVLLEDCLEGMVLWLIKKQQQHILIVRRIYQKASLGAYLSISQRGEAFFLTFSKKKFLAPLAAYLQSPVIEKWLEHFLPRSKRLSHKEATLKILPIPEPLLKVLEHPLEETFQAFQELLLTHPEQALEELLEQEQALEGQELLRWNYFAALSEALCNFEEQKTHLSTLFQPKGHLCWLSFLNFLPKDQVLSFPKHPFLKVQNPLPSFLPIARCESLPKPKLGFRLITETGFHTTVECRHPLLYEILKQIFKQTHHPTWKELSENIVLPKDLNQVQTTAKELYQNYEEYQKKHQFFQQMMCLCLQWRENS